MAETKLPSTESWDDFIETFIKPKHFKKFPDKVFVAFVHADLNRDGEPQLICDVQYNGQKYKWDVNKTNMRKLRDLGIPNPKALQNKQVVFNKIRVQNPRTNQSVDSLEVIGVE